MHRKLSSIKTYIKQLINGLPGSASSKKRALPQGLTLQLKTLNCQPEIKSFLYRLLTGNLVGYFVSISIVSIFLGIGLLIKNYKLITGFSLLKSITFSYEKILPMFSQVIFGLLTISLLLIGSLFIYAIMQRYLFDPCTKTASKLFRIVVIFMVGYLLLELGRLFGSLWHGPILYLSQQLLGLLNFTYEKLSGFSYDISLALLIMIISVFFLISRKFFSLPLRQQDQRLKLSIADLTPMLVSVIQVITIVGMILMINVLVLGILLAITINKTMLLYYLILMLGLGMTYVIQELFILKNWQRPLGLGVKLTLGGMYIIICLALEGTTIKLLQFFT
jgi:hypothetical protein